MKWDTVSAVQRLVFDNEVRVRAAFSRWTAALALLRVLDQLRQWNHPHHRLRYELPAPSTKIRGNIALRLLLLRRRSVIWGKAAASSDPSIYMLINHNFWNRSQAITPLITRSGMQDANEVPGTARYRCLNPVTILFLIKVLPAHRK